MLISAVLADKVQLDQINKGPTQSFVSCLHERDQYNIDGGKCIDHARKKWKTSKTTSNV